jgi:hypothetical protein
MIVSNRVRYRFIPTNERCFSLKPAQRAIERGARAIFARAKVMCLLLVLLPNAVPINLLVESTPLTVWKQLGVIILYSQLLTFNRYILPEFAGRLKKIKFWVGTTLFISSILCLLSLYIGLSAARIVYAIIAYVGFLPFVLLPLICAKHGGERSLFKMLALLGIFCGLGLIVDYYFNVFHLLAELANVPAYTRWADRYGDGFKRATFFFDTSSNIFPLMSLALLSLFFLVFKSKSKKHVLLCLGGIVVVLLGIFVTQGRTQWMMSGVFLLAAIVIGLRHMQQGRLPFFIVILIGVVALAWVAVQVVSAADQSDMIIARLNSVTSLESMDEGRVGLWQAGMQLLGDFSPQWLIGHGLGTTLGQIDDGLPVNTHYESSFFQAFYEGGLLGLVIRYWPFLLSLLFLIQGSKEKSVLRPLLILWLFCYFVVVFIAPTAGAYHGQMSYFIVLGLSATAKHFEDAF